ncbi:MAG: NfeD family protein [Paludibacteraceae bacterium]|jgi:membrane protein implicated in regulation of membrane protease activity|nr:NfeD family protein [Paludibacteraceae bacterium]
MELYHYWLLFAAVLVIVEIVTTGFGIVCFAFGTLAGAALAYFGYSFNWQMMAFAAGSLLAFFIIRPLALKYITKKQQYVPMNAEALVGMQGVVTEEINPAQHTGRVAVNGDDWKAVIETDEVIPVGTNVTVIKQDSLVLTVVRQ